MAESGTSKNIGGSTAIQQLIGDITMLIRQEIELAKMELGEKVKLAGIGAGMLIAAAVAGVITLGCLTALAALLLSLVIPTWTALLAVAVLWGATTAILALFGKRSVEDAGPFVPERTIANLKEDAGWSRRRAKRSRT